ncbi:heme ABC transporter ATP-binding protein [Photobacterium phosphoreum]|jgi:iron complex transport system ATP-binding protein|uniref:Heme ABC transporter ATP-binding protein n=1 Tax=Photobacterium phosphoreum TaxID=659 RepID=A0AAW4ZSE9_PHOPO|nr:heme ABC transporter ATP-binding protein [Photobacterium phosphoreum]MCD9462779.1 heme ABC transporter ATP-binding protein [Photobacterium phosphoreum]MCD9478820.1 heme ABC transporter ATP-binding protein [Photobacterium phosphoreum]MCD9482921.1 heme ABC transporter ATP-binding protein [Photobacterium phosphoreum]MCD9490008.1 heme ABC transporter ATP-binding protein [Photobacterium phosphoreum]MCD9511040.1 heme ABC transporter ATP-binding protein [Photobacterium phosphoreum]
MTATCSRPTAITARNLQLKLADKVLLDNFSIDIKAGEVTALLGPNGAGKSTLLKILCGEIAPESGDVAFFNRDINDWPRAELARHLGILPQHSSLSFAFTCKEVVELGTMPLCLSRQEIEQITTQTMHNTDVTHLAQRLYPTLSGGEKQRIHFARVLTQLNQAHDKCILMLDEPTSALDLAHQHKTLQTAQTMATQGAAVIVVLHDLNLAAQYAQRMVILQHGKIQADGPPWQALNPTVINTVYGWQVSVHPHPIHGYPYVLSSS